MGWRSWAGLMVFSVVLHLCVFWPLPAPRFEGSVAQALSVRLAPVLTATRTAGETLSSNPACCEGAADIPQAARVDAAEARKAGSRRSAQGRIQKVEAIKGPETGGVGERPEVGRRTVQMAKEPVRLEEAQVETGEAVAPLASPARYRLALAAAAVRLQRYPRTAIDGGLEGTVTVDVRPAPGATAPVITVWRSSGVAELDGEALALLERAVRAVPVSLRAQGPDFFVRLPVRFELPGGDAP